MFPCQKIEDLIPSHGFYAYWGFPHARGGTRDGTWFKKSMNKIS